MNTVVAGLNLCLMPSAPPELCVIIDTNILPSCSFLRPRGDTVTDDGAVLSVAWGRAPLSF